MRRLTLYWLPVVAWMGFIFLLSAQSQLPTLPGSWLEGLYDKLGHFMSFGILAWLLWRALRLSHPPSLALAATCAALALAYGITDEYHQSFVPGRTPSVADLVADGLGAITAMVLATSLARRAEETGAVRDAQ